MIKPEYELATWMFAARLSLTEDGYDANEIMLDAGLDLATLKSSSQQIPKVLVDKVWRKIEEKTKDDAYCLRTLAHLCDPFLNALVTSIKASGSVQNALQLLLKYTQVVHPGMEFSLSTSNQMLKLVMKPKSDEAFITISDVDVTFCLFSRLSSEILSTEHKPTVIYLTRSKPKNVEGYLSHFECPIMFAAETDSIEFPIDVLNGEIPGVDPSLSKCLEQYLEEQVDSHDAVVVELPIEDEVMEILERCLHKGTPRINDVACELGMSVRSLQRRLRDSGISFSEILSKTRLNVAKEKLSQGSYDSVESIASEIGFTEASNFMRFFKQQTGQTPSTFVKQITLN